jgi:ribonucleases P/MRP protein subunit RPP40
VLNKRQLTYFTNLLESINDWTIPSNNKQSVIVAYTDHLKAFDAISHTKLLSKLTTHEISGCLLSWIKGFQSNRTQQMRVGSTLSNVASLVSGLVQGSIIGPLLFLLFTSDVVDLFTDDRCAAKLYADDLKIYTNIELSDDVSV